MIPLRRRTPHVFGHGSNLKLVSAAGFAPAIPRSQAECVGCYATRCLPRRFGRRRGLGSVAAGRSNLERWPAVRTGGLEGNCTLNPPADNGALCSLSYESEMVGSAGNAPARHFQLRLTTPDLQSGSRITSREIRGEKDEVRSGYESSFALHTSHFKLVAGVGVAPTEAELMRLA